MVGHEVPKLSEGVFDLAEVFQALLAAEFPFFFLQRRSGRVRARRWRQRGEADAPDLEVFFKPVGLEQVDEFEGADIAAVFPDFPLQVGDDLAQVGQGEASAKPFEPLSFPVEAQAQVLAGQLAVELVGGGDLFGDGGIHIRLRLKWLRWRD